MAATSFPQIPLMLVPPASVQRFPVVNRDTLRAAGTPAPDFDPTRAVQAWSDPGAAHLPKGTPVTYSYADSSDNVTVPIPIKQFTLPAEQAATPNLPGSEPNKWKPFVVQPSSAHYVVNGQSSTGIPGMFLCTKDQADAMLAELKQLVPTASYRLLEIGSGSAVAIDWAGDPRRLFNFTIPGYVEVVQGGLLLAVRLAGGVDANGNGKPGVWVLPDPLSNALPSFNPTSVDAGLSVTGKAMWILPMPIRDLTGGEYLAYGSAMGVMELRVKIVPAPVPTTGGGLTADEHRVLYAMAAVLNVPTQ
jgi:hypothetical protein